MTKMSFALALAVGVVLLTLLPSSLSFTAPVHGLVASGSTGSVPAGPKVLPQSTAAPASTSTPMYGMALLATCAAGFLARMKRNVKVACHEAMHGIKFSYSIQKDAYVDLEFLNDVGYLPDGTPMNKAGNAINHPETIQPDPHTPGSPLPRALFCNSVGYLPDGTPMNAAGNAMNHPETMQPDMHTPGSPLPPSHYYADVGYLVDGTDMATAGNLSVQGAPAPAPSMPAPPVAAPMPVAAPTPMAPPSSVSGDVMHGIKFKYAIQKDAHVDLEFLNDVGYLPDGTPMNKAGNAINHPETIQPDPHTPGSPLPRALFCNSVGYLPDGTPMNAAGNAMNHPETMQPDMHTPGSPLPPSHYYADVGYLVDGTDMATAGNLSVQEKSVAVKAAEAVAAAVAAAMPASPVTVPETAPVAAAFVGASAQAPAKTRQPMGFAYSIQQDVYADFLFTNDVGYLPDGTPMNKAGNCMNHPENIGPDPHAPGSPLPRANFVNDVGYLPDGTPMNMAGNAINHPENISADPHSPGSALPPSSYAADIGYLVDGTPLDAAGNNAVH